MQTWEICPLINISNLRLNVSDVHTCVTFEYHYWDNTRQHHCKQWKYRHQQAISIIYGDHYQPKHETAKLNYHVTRQTTLHIKIIHINTEMYCKKLYQLSRICYHDFLGSTKCSTNYTQQRRTALTGTTIIKFTEIDNDLMVFIQQSTLRMRTDSIKASVNIWITINSIDRWHHEANGHLLWNYSYSSESFNQGKVGYHKFTFIVTLIATSQKPTHNFLK